MSTTLLKETAKHCKFVPPITVGSTATALSVGALPDTIAKGLLIKAPGTTDDTPNTESVFIGRSSVTADWAATGGFPLAPGESITLPIEEVGSLYAISASGSQHLNCILV